MKSILVVNRRKKRGLLISGRHDREQCPPWSGVNEIEVFFFLQKANRKLEIVARPGVIA